MTDVKLTALTELTTPTVDDMLYVVDSPGGSPASKKVSVANAVDARYMGVPLTDPTLQTWSWVNQGTSSIVESNRRCFLLPQQGANTYNHRMRVKTAPSTPYVITALIASIGVNSDAGNCGLVFRESSSGKLHTFVTYFIGNVRNFFSRKMNSPTSYNSDYTSAYITAPNPTWMRIEDTGTNRICSLSPDGFNWYAYYTVGRTDFLTADQVGFIADPYNVTTLPLMSLLSWAEA